MPFLRLLFFCGLLTGPGLLVGRAQPAPAFDRALLYGQVVPGATTGTILFADCAVDAQGNSYVLGTFEGSVSFGSLSTPAASGGLTRGGFLAKLGAGGTWEWFEALPETAVYRALALDTQGNVYVTGSFGGLLVLANTRLTTPSPSSHDIFVGRLDGATRAWRWVVQAGGTGQDVGQGVAVSPAGALFVAGTYNSPVAAFGPVVLTATPNPQNTYPVCFLSRLDPLTGAWQWSVRGGREANAFGGLAADASGAYLSGTFSGSAPFGALLLNNSLPNRGQDLFVAKADAATGAWLWASGTQSTSGSSQFYFAGNMYSRGLVTDGRGVYVGGGMQTPSCQIGAATLTNYGGTTVTGTSANRYTSLNTDVFVARVSAANGAWGWATQIGTQDDEQPKALALDPMGRLYLAGAGFLTPAASAAGVGNLFVTELDTAAGARQWTVSAGGSRRYGWFQGPAPLFPSADLAVAAPLRSDGQGRLHLAALAQFGPTSFVPLANSPQTGYYLARLSGGALAVTKAAPAGAWTVYPNPAGGGAVVWAQGPGPGQVVAVRDALGRPVAQGRMPANGPLHLPLPAGLPPGLYLVHSGGQAQRLVVE